MFGRPVSAPAPTCQLLFECQTLGVSSDGVTKVRRSRSLLRVSKSHWSRVSTLMASGGIHLDGGGQWQLPPVSGAYFVRASDASKAAEILSAAGFRVTDRAPISLLLEADRFDERENEPGAAERAARDAEQVLGPVLWSKLRPFQRVTVCRSALHGSMIIGDEMGSGKTFQAMVCAWFHMHKEPVSHRLPRTLVVCPSSLRNTWRSELRQWLGAEAAVVWKGKDLDTASASDAKYLVISYAMLTTHWRKLLPRWGQSVVVDESHSIKHRGSQRSIAVLAVCERAKLRLLLSGTPMNCAAEIFSQAQAVCPSLMPKFMDPREMEAMGDGSQPLPGGGRSFVARYTHAKKRMFHGRANWVFKGVNRATELGAALNLIMLRRLKSEILTQLPCKLRVMRELTPLNERQKKELKRITEKKNDPYAFTEAFRLTCKFKIPAVAEYVRECLVPLLRDVGNSGEAETAREGHGECVLIFCHHAEMRVAVSEALGEVPHFSIHQGTTEKQRADYQQAFQRGDGTYRAAVLSIKAAGTGLTLTQASRVVFAELLFGPDDMLQAEDRAHRMGQQAEQVHVEYLVMPDSTDPVNWAMIRNKERSTSMAIDGQERVLEMGHHNISEKPSFTTANELGRVMPVTKRQRLA